MSCPGRYRAVNLRRCMGYSGYGIIAGLLLLVMQLSYYHNALDYMMASSFTKFSYPLDINMTRVVEEVMQKKQVQVDPINAVMYPVILDNDRKCKFDIEDDESIFLLYIIKSSMENFALRDIIRKTWADEDQVSWVSVRRMFFLGVRPQNKQLQHRVALEATQNGDIVQEFFYDGYFNNTLKTMAGFRWATSKCRSAKFIAFMDDDYYVSTHNLLKTLYPIQKPHTENFVMGYVWKNAMPFRGRNSKWFISLEEYPFRFWPPYPTAGSYVVSMEAAQKIYIAMQYTKFLRFDDTFVGIVLWKLGIKPIHNENFYFYKLPYDKEKFAKVIAAHDYKDPEILFKMWSEQEELRKKKEN